MGGRFEDLVVFVRANSSLPPADGIGGASCQHVVFFSCICTVMDGRKLCIYIVFFSSFLFTSPLKK